MSKDQDGIRDQKDETSCLKISGRVEESWVKEVGMKSDGGLEEERGDADDKKAIMVEKPKEVSWFPENMPVSSMEEIERPFLGGEVRENRGLCTEMNSVVEFNSSAVKSIVDLSRTSKRMSWRKAS